jgi:signal peptidase I
MNKRGWFSETVIVVIQAFVLALIVRTLILQPFNIPSGSMKSTLLIGDYLFVSKFSYGYSRHSLPYSLLPFSGRLFAAEPKRGDVAVFKLPSNLATDYIKRVIGLPGDKVQMRNGVLHINSEPVPKRRIDDFVEIDENGNRHSIPQFEETLPNGVKYIVLDEVANGPSDNTRVYEVPAGHYFMMGDNRDNSSDSRVSWMVGPVPMENFVGRADWRFFSADETISWFNPLEWPGKIRWSRFFTTIK